MTQRTAMRGIRATGVLALGVALGLAGPLAPGARAQVGRDEPRLADSIDVAVLGREVHAFGTTGGSLTVRLQRDEKALWSDSVGRVGVVVTSRRVLGVTPQSAAWNEVRLQLDETPPPRAQLGDRIALAVTSRRALGFDATSGNWVESDLGPRESVLAVHAGSSTGVVATDRRVLGVSPDRGGFFSADLQLGERLERVDARAGSATVTTSRRVLHFRGRSGRWIEDRRPLD